MWRDGSAAKEGVEMSADCKHPVGFFFYPRTRCKEAPEGPVEAEQHYHCSGCHREFVLEKGEYVETQPMFSRCKHPTGGMG